MWTFDNIYRVMDAVNIASQADVDAAEVALGSPFPAGYREYATTLGKGKFCGLVMVYSPAEVVKSHAGYRKTLDELDHLSHWKYTIRSVRVVQNDPLAGQTARFF